MLRVAACESPQPPFTAPTKPSRISHQPESYAQLSVCVIIADTHNLLVFGYSPVGLEDLP